jgi:hypothetical protein
MKPESTRVLLIITALTCLGFTIRLTNPPSEPTTTKITRLKAESPVETQTDTESVKVERTKAAKSVAKSDNYDESKFIYKPSVPPPNTLVRLICEQGNFGIDPSCGFMAANVQKQTTDNSVLVQVLSNYVSNKTGKTSSQIMQTALTNFQAEDRQSQLFEAKEKYKNNTTKPKYDVETKIPDPDRNTFVGIVCTLEGMTIENIRICQDSAENMQRNMGNDRATILTAINFTAVVTETSPKMVEEKAKAVWVKMQKDFAANTCPKDGIACD